MCRDQKLMEIANNEGIHFHYTNFPAPLKGIYIRDNDIKVIGINTGLSYEEERCIFAEEMGHHFTLPSGIDLRNESWEIRKPFEQIATIYAAKTLMPEEQVSFLIKKGRITLESRYLTVTDFAKEFRVTEEMALHRLNLHYFNRVFLEKHSKQIAIKVA